MKKEISAIASMGITVGAILLFSESVSAKENAVRVLEFRPAPGQFMNLDLGMNPGDAIGSVEQNGPAGDGAITDEGVVSLGGFGGYVVVGFEEPVRNDPRNRYGVDFTIIGNTISDAIYNASCEPAAVMVMKDHNGNGLPDDGEWYELAGSDYHFRSTRRGLKVDYVNPLYTNAHTVWWDASDGSTGGVLAVGAHTQPYYPDAYLYPGIEAEGMSAEGTCIRGASDRRNPNGVYFYRSPAFGYADCHLSAPAGDYPHNPYYADERGGVTDGFDISWAVDRDGNPVELDEIDFVKIYTAGLANLGWIGEWSSEIDGIVVTEADEEYTPQDYYLNYICVNQPTVALGTTARFEGLAFCNGKPIAGAKGEYSVDNPTIGTIDGEGLFTPLKTGRTKIRFSATAEAPADEVEVTVTQITGVLCTLSTRATAAAKGDCIVGERLYIPMESTDNYKEIVSGGVGDRYVYDSYSWYSSNPEVGVVDEYGTFTARAVGSTVVSAVSKGNPECYAEVMVTVKAIPAIALLKSSRTIPSEAPEGNWSTAELLRSTNKSTILLESVWSEKGSFECRVEGNRVVYDATDRQSFEDVMHLKGLHYEREVEYSIPVSYVAKESGISDVEDGVREGKPEVWYSISGVALGGRPEEPGLYLQRRGTEVRKVMVRGDGGGR